MTDYTNTLTLTLPYTPELADIASRISRALDPDVGGADSWTREVVGYDADDNQVYSDNLICSTPCTREFYDQAMVILETPDVLFQLVTQDYSNRWREEIPPTLEECRLFVASLSIL